MNKNEDNEMGWIDKAVFIIAIFVSIFAYKKCHSQQTYICYAEKNLYTGERIEGDTLTIIDNVRSIEFRDEDESVKFYIRYVKEKYGYLQFYTDKGIIIMIEGRNNHYSFQVGHRKVFYTIKKD